MGLRHALVGALALLSAGCAATVPAPAVGPVPVVRPEVLAELPHDTAAFTEGFEIADGTLYESTGIATYPQLDEPSQLREIDPATGAVRRTAALPVPQFGEGLTVVGDRIWQLTWRDGVALEWDRGSLTLLRQVPVTGEGWGLCFDGTRLARTDGTALLRFHDPSTFAETGSVEVTLDGRPVPMLNELECVDGQVWANVWQTDRIVRIDPSDGRVTAVVDASGLLPADRRAGTDVLNGIASLGGGEYLLTGKLWPSTFRVRIPEP